VFESLGFPSAYQARVLEREPPGARPHYFTVARMSTAYLQGLVVEVAPHDAEPWVGVFAGVNRRYPSGVYASPMPDRVIVVCEGAGYLVPVHRPTAFESLATLPVREVRRISGAELLLLVGVQDLVAYGPDGLLWRVERLSREELTVESVDPAVVRGSATTDEGTAAFQVDARTGAVIGGWREARTIRRPSR